MIENNSSNATGSAGLRPLSRFALEVGKTTCTLWRWRKQGWLETINVAGKIYVSDAAVERFKTRASAGEFAKTPVVPARHKEAA